MLKRVKTSLSKTQKRDVEGAVSYIYCKMFCEILPKTKTLPKMGRLCFKEIDYRNDNYYTNLYLYKIYFSVGVDSTLMFNAFTAEFI